MVHVVRFLKDILCKSTGRVKPGNDVEMGLFNLEGSWKHYERVMLQTHPQGTTAIHSLRLVHY